MRSFEMHKEDFAVAMGITTAIVDLNAIVALVEDIDRNTWSVRFANGEHYSLTNAAYNRLLAAWISN